jgi:PEP-CTERM motif
MRKSLWTIFTILLLAISASIARADSPSLNNVSLLAAPDVSFPSVAAVTSAGYDFSSPFASNWAPTTHDVLGARSISHTSRGVNYDSGVSISSTALAAYGQTLTADCKPKPCPIITPVPEPSSGILALSGIGLMFMAGNYRRNLNHISK